MFTKIRKYIASKIYNFENDYRLVDAQAKYIEFLHDHLLKMNSVILQILPPVMEINKTLQDSIIETNQLKEELLLAHKALLKAEIENKTEEDKIAGEVSFRMEHDPIPYLVEMLNSDICHTMSELYDPIPNSRHPIEWSPDIYSLNAPLVKDLITLLTSKDKEEIIMLYKYIVGNSPHNLLLSFYDKLQTKASNKIITTLMSLIANESLK